MWDGELSYRRLSVLLRHLPPESSYATILRDSLTDEEAEQVRQETAGKHGPWSRQDFLLASVIDALRELVWVQIAKSGAKGVPIPDPVPRPGLKAAAAGVVDPKARAYLEGLRAQHREAVTEPDD